MSTQDLMEELVKDPEFLDQFKSWEDVMAFLQLAMTEGIAIPASRNGVDSGSKESGQGKIPDGLLSAMNKPGQKPFSYLGGVDLKQQLQGMKERRRQAMQASAKAKAAKDPELHAPISARPAPATIIPSKNTMSPPLPSGAVGQVHAQYNSPIPVYSNDNINEAFIAQAGGAAQGMQERPKKDESEVAKFIRETESGGKPGQSGSEEGEFRGGSAANKQSMSFRVLQWMTDTDKSEADTDSLRKKREKDPEFRHNSEDDEMRFSGLNRGTGIPSKSFSRLQKLTVNDQGPQQDNQFLSPNGAENEDGEVGKYDETSIRYKGKYIPSPAFRVLQNWAELDPLEVSKDSSEKVPDRARDNEDVQNPDEVPLEKRYTGGNIPSRVFKTLQMAVGDDQGSDKESSSAPAQSTNQTPASASRGIKIIHKPSQSAGATDF